MTKQQMEILISVKDKASKAIRKVSTKLKKLGRTAKKVGSGMGKAFKGLIGTLFNLKTSVIALAGAAGLGALAKGIISTGIEFENYRATLKVVLGSQEKANKSFAWLQDFAKKTPFAINTLSESFVKLAAYGIDGTKSMQSLGDAAAAMGKDILMAVEAMADAQTGEFERLKEFGIKAIQITKANATRMGASLTDVGKTALAFTDKMGKEAFKIIDRNNRKQVTSTIQAIWNEKYEGAMEERSKTLGGILNNMGDDWMTFKNRVAEDVLPLMKTRLKQFSEAVGKYFLASGGAAEGWQNMLAISMKSGTEYITGFTAELFNEAYKQGLIFKDMTDDSAKWQTKGRDHAKFLIDEYKSMKKWLTDNGSSMWDGIKQGANSMLTIINALAWSIKKVISGFKTLNKFGYDIGKSIANTEQNIKDSAQTRRGESPASALPSNVTNIYTQNSRHGVDNALNSRGDMSLQVGRSTLGLAQ